MRDERTACGTHCTDRARCSTVDGVHLTKSPYARMASLPAFQAHARRASGEISTGFTSRRKFHAVRMSK
eukprot:scaffold284180_cov32-Tisochrysis_lutea.AAC.6